MWRGEQVCCLHALLGIAYSCRTITPFALKTLRVYAVAIAQCTSAKDVSVPWDQLHAHTHAHTRSTPVVLRMASFRFALKHPCYLVAGETNWPFCTELLLNGQSWGEHVPPGHVLFLYTHKHTFIHTQGWIKHTKCLLNISFTPPCEIPAKAARAFWNTQKCMQKLSELVYPDTGSFFVNCSYETVHHFQQGHKRWLFYLSSLILCVLIPHACPKRFSLVVSYRTSTFTCKTRSTWQATASPWPTPSCITDFTHWL